MRIDDLQIQGNNVSSNSGVATVTQDTANIAIVSGQAFALSYMRRTNGATRGGTNTAVIIYGTAAESNGTDITYVNSAANGDSFTINTTGIYCVSASFRNTTSDGISFLNVGSVISNTPDNATSVRALLVAASAAGSTRCSASWTGLITAGQIVWITTNSTTLANEVNNNQITIVRLK